MQMSGQTLVLKTKTKAVGSQGHFPQPPGLDGGRWREESTLGSSLPLALLAA